CVRAIADRKRRLARLVSEEVEARLELRWWDLAVYHRARGEGFEASRGRREHAVDGDGAAYHDCDVTTGVMARVVLLNRWLIPGVERGESTCDRKAERM